MLLDTNKAFLTYSCCQSLHSAFILWGCLRETKHHMVTLYYCHTLRLYSPSHRSENYKLFSNWRRGNFDFLHPVCPQPLTALSTQMRRICHHHHHQPVPLTLCLSICPSVAVAVAVAFLLPWQLLWALNNALNPLTNTLSWLSSEHHTDASYSQYALALCTITLMFSLSSLSLSSSFSPSIPLSLPPCALWSSFSLTWGRQRLDMPIGHGRERTLANTALWHRSQPDAKLFV